MSHNYNIILRVDIDLDLIEDLEIYCKKYEEPIKRSKLTSIGNPYNLKGVYQVSFNDGSMKLIGTSPSSELSMYLKIDDFVERYTINQNRSNKINDILK